MFPGVTCALSLICVLPCWTSTMGLHERRLKSTFCRPCCILAGMAGSPLGPVPWDDLHVFLVLRRTLTFAAAARTLEVDATTVSRRLARLEERLGTQLFQ